MLRRKHTSNKYHAQQRATNQAQQLRRNVREGMKVGDKGVVATRS